MLRGTKKNCVIFFGFFCFFNFLSSLFALFVFFFFFFLFSFRVIFYLTLWNPKSRRGILNHTVVYINPHCDLFFFFHRVIFFITPCGILNHTVVYINPCCDLFFFLLLCIHSHFSLKPETLPPEIDLWSFIK